MALVVQLRGGRMVVWNHSGFNCTSKEDAMKHLNQLILAAASITPRSRRPPRCPRRSRASRQESVYARGVPHIPRYRGCRRHPPPHYAAKAATYSMARRHPATTPFLDRESTRLNSSHLGI